MSQAAPTIERLTPEQVEQYHARGYVAGFPVFGEAEVARFQSEYEKLVAFLPPGKSPNFVNWWHKKNRFIYDLCMDPRLLDFAEAILGPSFYLWGSHFFVKEPGDETVVPWHQDAQYWPLSPQNAVTVYVAFTDCDRENACLRSRPGRWRRETFRRQSATGRGFATPGSHRARLRHHTSADGRYVLKQEIDDAELDPEDAVDLVLRAGQISLHHDGIAHGSGPNRSNRRRVGFTMRFSGSEVKCDLAVWPNFQAFPARGTDTYRHNPEGVPPTGYGAPSGMME